MRKSKIRLVCAVACLTLAAPLFAQYGHPLKGSWSGDWWLVKGQNNHILLDFNFVAGGFLRYETAIVFLMIKVIMDLLIHFYYHLLKLLFAGHFINIIF